MSTAVNPGLRARVRRMESMPAMPAILAQLMRCLELPPDQIEVEKVTELISTDKAIAAQCVRMANSPLVSPRSPINTVRGAVVALGARRLRDILWSSFLARMAPKTKWPLKAEAFWEHSFGCALVSQKLAKKIGLPEPDKIYLCGLLHDIGEIVNVLLAREEFTAAVKIATDENLPLIEAEQQVMGFTHCDTGKWLAEAWNFPPDLCEVIEFHYSPERAQTAVAAVAVINLADALCRLVGLGYGYDELLEFDAQEAPAWRLLEAAAPQVRYFDVARFALELDGEAEKIHLLVASAFQG